MASINPIPTAVLTTTTAEGDTPPIAQILPILSQSASFILSASIFIGNTLLSILSFLSYPILALSPLRFVLFAMSPAIVLGQAILDMLIFTPYRLVTIFLDIIYPLYVLVGVACLTGAMLGLSARGIVGLLNAVVNPPNMPEPLEQALIEEKPVKLKRRRQSR